MDFKATKNPVTGKITYYVDSKKVSHDKYEFYYTKCFIKNLHVSGHYTTTDKKGYIRCGFSFN